MKRKWIIAMLSVMVTGVSAQTDQDDMMPRGPVRMVPTPQQQGRR